MTHDFGRCSACAMADTCSFSSGLSLTLTGKVLFVSDWVRVMQLQ
jgi:hypothetical protein